MFNLKNCKMKNLKVMMIALMIIFIGLNSHSQEMPKSSVEDINLRLNESSSYLIRANNQAIGSVATGIATSLIAGLLLNHKSSDESGSANNKIGTAIAVGGGITSLSLGISSIVNKRRGYKRLGGLKL